MNVRSFIEKMPPVCCNINFYWFLDFFPTWLISSFTSELLLYFVTTIKTSHQFWVHWMFRYCRLLIIFKTFSSKIRHANVFSSSGVKVTEGFSVISNLTLTTRIAIKSPPPHQQYIALERGFLWSKSLNRNKVLNLQLHLKIFFLSEFSFTTIHES